MAPRGPKPKPVELKLVAGNAGKRALPDPEKLPKAKGEPPLPSGLDETERREWRRVCDAMAAAGTLGAENGAAIEIYVRNIVRMRRAERHVQKHGPIVAAPRTGVPQHNPYLTTANKAAEIVMRLAAELGLTPSSRGRVSGADGGQADPDDGFFARPAAGGAR